MSPLPVLLSLRRRGRKATVLQNGLRPTVTAKVLASIQSSRSQGKGISKIVGLDRLRMVKKANSRTKAGVWLTAGAPVAHPPNNGHDNVGPNTHERNSKSPHLAEASRPPRGDNRSKAPIFAASAVSNPRCRPFFTVGNASHGRPPCLARGETAPRCPLPSDTDSSSGEGLPLPFGIEKRGLSPQG